VNLFRAELIRFVTRRFIAVMIVVILGILAVSALSVAANSQPIGAAEREIAAEQSRQDFNAAIGDMQSWYDLCVADVSSPAPTGQYGSTLADCEATKEKLASITPNPVDSYLPHQFRLRWELQDSIYVAAAVLAVFGFLVGASFVGAEWTSGGMTNLLLWHPRRIQVLAAKLGTALLGVLAVCAGYLAVWIGTLWTIAATRGDTSNATPGFWQSITLLCVRSAVLAMIGAAIGFALAMLGRHTAMALGVGLAYAMIVEIGTRIIFGLNSINFPERFQLATYVIAWLSKRVDLYDPGLCRYAFDTCEPKLYVIDLATSGTVLGALVVAIVAAAALVFRRRDVA
jgi:ABC-2 type transport system permease protein